MKRGRGRARRSAMLQHRMVWQGAALLLVRPDAQFGARLTTVEEMLGHLDAGFAMPLGRAGAVLRGLDARTAALNHALTFDKGGRRDLLITHWLADDNRERVVHRQRFVDAYRAAGVPMPAGEMPDHLAVVLDFAAHVDPEAGRRLLIEHGAQLAAMQRALGAADSPYAHVLAAVCATLPAPDEQDLRSAPAAQTVDPQRVAQDAAGSASWQDRPVRPPRS